MSDVILTAMIPPQQGVTYCTRDGEPYRGDPDTGLVQAMPQHVAELQSYGFTLASASQVPPGDDTQQDVGWDPTA